MRYGVNAKWRKLNQYSVRKNHPYRTVGGAIDWDRPVYYVRPRNFSTVLAKIEAQPGTDKTDLDGLLSALEALCDMPAPERKVQS